MASDDYVTNIAMSTATVPSENGGSMPDLPGLTHGDTAPDQGESPQPSALDFAPMVSPELSFTGGWAPMTENPPHRAPLTDNYHSEVPSPGEGIPLTLDQNSESSLTGEGTSLTEETPARAPFVTPLLNTLTRLPLPSRLLVTTLVTLLLLSCALTQTTQYQRCGGGRTGSLLAYPSIPTCDSQRLYSWSQRGPWCSLARRQG